MISERCEKCKNIGCNNDNFICNNWSEEKRKEYSGQYKNPGIKTKEQHILDKYFTEVEENLYKSKNKSLGAGTGDDSTLYIYCDSSSTAVWWKENRGFERTIFEGRSMKNEQDFENLFDLLELKLYLKWDGITEY